MQIIKHKELVRDLRISATKEGKSIAFVPTMGSLHQGHLSLVAEAKKKSDIAIVSIFVNPTQFGVNEDFNSYPRDLEKDLNLLAQYEPLYIFTPDTDEIYGKEHKTWIEVTELSDQLCGKSRPGHFRGVVTVVAKLLNIISPDVMILGEKDFQQLTIIKKMAADLDFGCKVIGCPIIREKNGLAMSSRNSYLSISARGQAASIYQALLTAQKLFRLNKEDFYNICVEMRKIIEENNGRVDYITAVDSATLEPIKVLKTGCRILAAAYFGNTRLIDNIEIV